MFKLPELGDRTRHRVTIVVWLKLSPQNVAIMREGEATLDTETGLERLRRYRAEAHRRWRGPILVERIFAGAAWKFDAVVRWKAWRPVSRV